MSTTNGQVRRQVEYEHVILPCGDEIVAEIASGALGSYFMSLNDGRRFRVRREQ